MEDTLDVDGTSSEFLVVGNCDIWVSELTTGSVSLELKFPKSNTWRTVPNATYSSDSMDTIFISEHGVKCRFTGSSNNAGVYVRLARFLND